MASSKKAKLPKGHVLSREQEDGEPQSLQGLTDTLGNSYPVVISTGRTVADEIEADAILAANPPQPVVPAQDPTPLEAGDEVPVNPVTGELSFQGGAAHIASPTQPLVATKEGEVSQQAPATVEVGEVQKAKVTRSGK